MATFFNQATLTYSGGTVNSNVTSGEIIEVLSAEKTAVVNTYTQGSEVTYIINIINSGNIAFTGLDITDNLGAYEFGDPPVTLRPLEYVDGSVKFFVNGVLQATPTVNAGPPLVISGINVPANGVATIAYTAMANEFAPPIGTGFIENTAVISGGSITAITVNEQIGASSEPALSINKSVTPTVVTENGQVTYTFVIQNSGNTEASAADNIALTDIFDPILENISVTLNGSPFTAYSYDEATGIFTTNAGAITVPAATYTQNPVTGAYITDPGAATLTVTGTI